MPFAQFCYLNFFLCVCIILEKAPKRQSGQQPFCSGPDEWQVSPSREASLGRTGSGEGWPCEHLMCWGLWKGSSGQ